MPVPSSTPPTSYHHPLPTRGGVWQPPYGGSTPTPFVREPFRFPGADAWRTNRNFTPPASVPRGPAPAASGAGYPVQATYGNGAGGVNNAYTPGSVSNVSGSALASRLRQSAQAQAANASFAGTRQPYSPLPQSAAGGGYSQTAQYRNGAGGVNSAYSPGATRSAIDATRSSIPNAAQQAAGAAATAQAIGGAGGIAQAGAGALAAPAAVVVAAAAGAALLRQRQSPEEKAESWRRLPDSYKESLSKTWGSPVIENPDGSKTYLPPFSPAPVGGGSSNPVGSGAAAAAAAAALGLLGAGQQIARQSVAGGAGEIGGPPFEGGQSPGVLYAVEIYGKFAVGPYPNGAVIVYYRNGPIGVVTSNGANYGGTPATDWFFSHGPTPNVDGNRTQIGSTFQYFPFPPWQGGNKDNPGSFKVHRVLRVDGQPDIGGNIGGEVYVPPAPPVLSRELGNVPALAFPPAKPQPPLRLPTRRATPPIPEQSPELDPAPLPPPGSLPKGHPLTPPEPPPAVQPPPPAPAPPTMPDGAPTGEPPPEATPENTPYNFPWPRQAPSRQGGRDQSPSDSPTTTTTTTTTGDRGDRGQAPSPFRDLPIPPLFMPAIPPGDRIQDPTKPGKFSTPAPTPPMEWEPPPPNAVSCRCNGPILAGQQAILAGQGSVGQKIDDAAAAAPQNLAPVLAAIAEMRTFVGKMQTFAEGAWKATHMDKVINLLTLISVLHNASMLSRDVAETLGYAIDNALQATGVKIKNEEGEQISVTEVVGKSVANFIKGIIGEDVYNNTREAYLKLNRIVSTASMTIWTIRNIGDSTQDLLEWTAQNTGKIGNALKRFGVVGERAYPWMSENAQARNRFRARFDKVTDQLENAENFASSFATGTSNILEITQETQELGQNFKDFKQSVTTFADDPWPDNQPVQENAAASAAEAQSPPIDAADTERAA